MLQRRRRDAEDDMEAGAEGEAERVGVDMAGSDGDTETDRRAEIGDSLLEHVR